MKIKKFTYTVISFFIIAGLFVYYEYKKPNCADAQTCMPFRPIVAYVKIPPTSTPIRMAPYTGCTGTASNPWITERGRITPPPSVTSYRFIGDPIVAITGWRACYRTVCSERDEHFSRLVIQIRGTPARNGPSGDFQFDYKACFHDRNWDNEWTFEIEYVVAMFWRP